MGKGLDPCSHAISLPIPLSAPNWGLSLAQLPCPLLGECIMLGKAVNPTPADGAGHGAGLQC